MSYQGRLYYHVFTSKIYNIKKQYKDIHKYNVSSDSSVGRATDCKSAGHEFKSHSEDP